MKYRTFPLAVLALVVALASAHAQSLGAKVLQKAKDKVEQKADQQADAAIDKAIATVECVLTDKRCIAKARKDGKKVVLTDADGEPIPDKGETTASPAGKVPATLAPATAAPVGEAWANFDFVPGSNILFSDDFARDRVGNFPQRLELVGGNLEIVDWQGKRWMRAVEDHSRFDVPLSAVLPSRFTLEFDIVIGEERLIYQHVHAASAAEPEDAYVALDGGDVKRDMPTTALLINQHEAGLGGGNAPTATKAYTGGGEANAQKIAQTVFRVRLQADGRYVKMYVNEDRVANVPSANFGRTNKLRFSLNGGTEGPVYIGNIVVAAGGQELYDALLADGRVATQGILFDTGSDRIRPESAPTLKTIGDMLGAHADLKLMIEGHTDNVGSMAANKTLSEQRAAAVRRYLTANFGIDAGRLASSGFGDARPSAPNTTPEGRQQNRRVELVKM